MYYNKTYYVFNVSYLIKMFIILKNLCLLIEAHNHVFSPGPLKAKGHKPGLMAFSCGSYYLRLCIMSIIS